MPDGLIRFMNNFTYIVHLIKLLATSHQSRYYRVISLPFWMTAFLVIALFVDLTSLGN